MGLRCHGLRGRYAGHRGLEGVSGDGGAYRLQDTAGGNGVTLAYTIDAQHDSTGSKQQDSDDDYDD